MNTQKELIVWTYDTPYKTQCSPSYQLEYTKYNHILYCASNLRHEIPIAYSFKQFWIAKRKTSSKCDSKRTIWRLYNVHVCVFCAAADHTVIRHFQFIIAHYARTIDKFFYFCLLFCIACYGVAPWREARLSTTSSYFF